ncbi:MAG: DUF4372 domain-containing protein [Nitrospiraceae bacterium]|nr:MAG: DUF4372 domain-containing protein [Nitrospiraceae bacterium]
MHFCNALMETRAAKKSKGFTCWQQFVGRLICQFGQAQSLRDFCGGLACCLGKIKPLGIQAAPNRSTLSYAN